MFLTPFYLCEEITRYDIFCLKVVNVMQVRYLITFTCGVLIITLNTSWWWSDEEQNSKHCSFNIILVTGVFSYMFTYTQPFWGPSWSSSYCSWIYNYICNQCLSPLMLWVRISKTTRCTALRDKVCQWLATGRWFSPGTAVSPINKTDHHSMHALSFEHTHLLRGNVCAT